MSLYTQIPSDAAETLQMNAGIIAKTFTPATGVVADIIGATTGGITITAAPSYSDLGEDIDNCPKNTKELKRLDSWECKIAGTYLTTTASKLADLIGAASLDSGDPTHITLSTALNTDDFADLWFIGDYGDAGYLAVKLSNALNTAGLSIKTSDKAKGQISFEYVGHTSLLTPTTMPLTIYVKDGDVHAVTYTLTACTRVIGPFEIADSTDLVARFVADAGKTLPATITVTEAGSELTVVTDYAWDVGTGVLVIPAVAGAIVVAVTATT